MAKAETKQGALEKAEEEMEEEMEEEDEVEAEVEVDKNPKVAQDVVAEEGSKKILFLCKVIQEHLSLNQDVFGQLSHLLLEEGHHKT